MFMFKVFFIGDKGIYFKIIGKFKNINFLERDSIMI